MGRRGRRRLALGVAALLAASALAVVPPLRHRAAWMIQRVQGKRTIADRLAEFGAAASARLAPWFARAGVATPPRAVVLAAFKDAARLELHADGGDGVLRFVRAWPVLAASGKPGPKLREGDWQVPEGEYGVELLNPNSRFHVSLRLDYPNADDRAHAAREGRSDLGGDIMIHGKAASIGCLAMGDEAAEELFWLAATIGIDRVRVVIAPTDFRAGDIPDPPEPPWLAERYARLRAAIRALPPAMP